MDFQVEKGRIFAADSTGKVIAEVLFPDVDNGTVNIEHTFVDKSLAGRGIAGQLIEAVCGQLRNEHKRAHPTCSYAAKWFEDHSDHSDVLVKSKGDQDP